MVNHRGSSYPTPAARRDYADRFAWRGLGGLVMVVAIAGCVVLYSLGTIKRIFLIFYLSGYGIMSLMYYSAITAFAMLNRRAVERKVADIKASSDDENKWCPSVSVHAVGYREDPAYYRSCLESVKGFVYSNIRCIAIIVDRNDEEDMYMSEIAEDVFGSSVTASIRLERDPRSTSEGYSRIYQRLIANPASETTGIQVYIISQPHKGKREVIYTAYKISEFLGVDFFLNTDSDTIIDPDAVSEMVMMTKNRPNVGAVAGMLTIFNTTNWLSTLSASRYILAFNTERASQSFHGVVNCISGPLGLYRTPPVRKFIEEWVDQEFMGKKCTFGDDRHLTNLLLSTGREVVYTHRASATTETPVEFTRFVAQQTRWSKSFWRAMLLQSKWAYKHWYMVMEMIYNVVFPVLIDRDHSDGYICARVNLSRDHRNNGPLFAPRPERDRLFLLGLQPPRVRQHTLPVPVLHRAISHKVRGSVHDQQLFLGYVFTQGSSAQLRPRVSGYRLESGPYSRSYLACFGEARVSVVQFILSGMFWGGLRYSFFRTIRMEASSRLTVVGELHQCGPVECGCPCYKELLGRISIWFVDLLKKESVIDIGSTISLLEY